MSYLSTVTTEDDLHREREEHNTVRNEFNTTLKMAKKAIKKSRSRDERTKEDAVKKAGAEIIRKLITAGYDCSSRTSDRGN